MKNALLGFVAALLLVWGGGCAALAGAAFDEDSQAAAERFQEAQSGADAFYEHELGLIRARLNQGAITEEEAERQAAATREAWEAAKKNARKAYEEYWKDRGREYVDAETVMREAPNAIGRGWDAFTNTGNVWFALLTGIGAYFGSVTNNRRQLVKNNAIRDKSREQQSIKPADVIL